MNQNRKKILVKTITWSFLIIILGLIIQCSSARKTTPIVIDDIIETNTGEGGTRLDLRFLKGDEHNHPLMAVWTEDTLGNYIETLYVAESIGTGIFQRGDKSEGKWMPGPIRRPAALPYWGHKRGIQASDGYYIPEPENPLPDAITGPTPQSSFILRTFTSSKNKDPFVVLFEINQSWDWNKYWTNNKYPDDEDYKTSSQPAVVYMAKIEPLKTGETFRLEPVGHSHYSGKNGILYDDLGTLTTALEIADEITVTVYPAK
jgi:hypothetical protein